MSFHNKPNYQIPEMIEALKAHRLPHDTPSQLADSFRIGWMACRELAQATAAQAAQAAVQDSITIRKPTTRAEMLWLLKLAHLVISDVDKTLEETFAPPQTYIPPVFCKPPPQPQWPNHNPYTVTCAAEQAPQRPNVLDATLGASDAQIGCFGPTPYRPKQPN